LRASKQNDELPQTERETKLKQFLKNAAGPATGLMALAFLAMANLSAQAGEFCVTNSSGMRGCGFATMEQCQATVAGINGSCGRDPFFGYNANASADMPGVVHTRILVSTKKPTH
jgi:Protein of unknown function (DUF3551)